MVDDTVCLRPGGAGGGSVPTWMKGATLGGRGQPPIQQQQDVDVQNK
jgi:hypothetical protein